MKKIILIFTMILILSGCGSKDETTTTPPPTNNTDKINETELIKNTIEYLNSGSFDIVEAGTNYESTDFSSDTVATGTLVAGEFEVEVILSGADVISSEPTSFTFSSSDTNCIEFGTVCYFYSFDKKIQEENTTITLDLNGNYILTTTVEVRNNISPQTGLNVNSKQIITTTVTSEGIIENVDSYIIASSTGFEVSDSQYELYAQFNIDAVVSTLNAQAASENDKDFPTYFISNITYTNQENVLVN